MKFHEPACHNDFLLSSASLLWSCNAAASPLSSAENKLHVTFQTQHPSESNFAKAFWTILLKVTFLWMHQSSSWSGLYGYHLCRSALTQEDRSGRQKPSSTSRTSRTWRLARWPDSQCMYSFDQFDMIFMMNFALLRYLKNTDQEILSSQSGPCSCNCFLRKLGCCWLCPCLSQSPR